MQNNFYPSLLRATTFFDSEESAKKRVRHLKCWRLLFFIIYLFIFLDLLHSVNIVWVNHQWAKSTCAGTPGSWSDIPAESALIITVSSLPSQDKEQQLWGEERSLPLSSTDCRRLSFRVLSRSLTSIVMNSCQRCLTACAWIWVWPRESRPSLGAGFVCASPWPGFFCCSCYVCFSMYLHPASSTPSIHMMHGKCIKSVIWRMRTKPGSWTFRLQTLL